MLFSPKLAETTETIVGRAAEIEQAIALPRNADRHQRVSAVRIRMEAEPHTLLPWLEYHIFTHEIADYIWDSLLRQDPDTLEWHGNLACSWKEEILVPAIGKPKHRFLFRLRKDARFHDGHPVTGEDVAFSIRAAANPRLQWPLGCHFAAIESCLVLDEYSVEVIYSHPYWMAKKHLGELHILPRHVFDPDDLSIHHPEELAEWLRCQLAIEIPVGSGPYRVGRWDRGRELVLERCAGSDTPGEKSRRIVFCFIDDHRIALQHLIDGNLDMIPRLDVQLYEEARRNPDLNTRFKCESYYTTYFDLIAWNLRRPCFQDKRVRQALAYGAIDRQRFLETHMSNQGILVTGSQYFHGPAYNHQISPHSFDQARAAALLNEAGWLDHDGDGIRDKDGCRFSFRLLLREGNKLARDRAEIMRATLARLQIHMEIYERPSVDFWQAMRNRDYDACSIGWMVEPESDQYQIWHSSQTGASGSNIACFEDPLADRLIEQTRGELDEAKRHRLSHQLHALIHEEQPYLFFYCRPNMAIYSNRLKNVVFHTRRPGFHIDHWCCDQDL